MAYYQEKSSNKKKIYIPVFVILVLLTCAGIYIWSSKSNEGSISTTAKSNSKVIETTYKILNGKHISFSYNGEYVVKTLSPAGQTDMEQYILTADTTYPKQLSVDVSILPGGNLNNNSSYNYRKTSPNVYTSKNISVQGTPAIEWIKNDGSEITVQIPRGGTIATLAFTTGSTADQLQPEVNGVLQSFQWK